ncbi:MAG TPA: zinc ribbon domain-containing protein, partial [Ktedonobacteraceae bacterium]|nr:zinc ribbon domain-containing protein [Ktedonobacteraceae bacterium]
MAIHCSHCGATLRRDDARFCSRCGSFVRSGSQSSKRGEVPFTPIMRQGRTRKAALREQIASQPSARPAQGDELVWRAKSTTDFNVEKSVEASNSLGEASSGDVGDKASPSEALGEDAEKKPSEVE